MSNNDNNNNNEIIDLKESSPLMRLIEFDDSKDFTIQICINEEEKNHDEIQVFKKSNITIKTTINKARVISKKINDIYKENQSIDHYEIQLNDINEKNKSQKVVDVFQTLLKSIGKKVEISKESKNIFSIIESHLGEDIDTTVPVKINRDDLKNILSFIKMKRVGNDGQLYAMTISANGSKEPQSSLENLFRYNTNEIKEFYYFNNYSVPNDMEIWIQFDFGLNKVNIASYKICSDKKYFPKTWKIVGSNDGVEWENLDEQIDNPELNGQLLNHQFEIKNNDKYFKFIRFVQLNQWTDNSYIISLSSIEFFGSINQQIIM